MQTGRGIQKFKKKEKEEIYVTIKFYLIYIFSSYIKIKNVFSYNKIFMQLDFYYFNNIFM